MTLSLAFDLALLPVLLLLAGLFSGSEAALFSLGPEDRGALEGSSAGRRVLRLLRRPNELLVATLIGNLFVMTAFSAHLEGLFRRAFGPASLPFAILCAALFLLLFGEVTPQRIAFATRRRFAILAAPFLGMVRSITFPIVRLYDRWTHPWTSRWSRDPAERITHGEVERGIEENPALSEDERKILLGLVRLDRARATDICVERDRIRFLSGDATAAQARAQVAAHGLSRWPVFESGDLDQPLGFAYAKDLLDLRDEARISNHLHALATVFADEPLDRVLSRFRSEKTHLARVVDAEGRTLGILSLEDVLERIFGDLGGGRA